jgi:hypothetical protein
MSAEGIGNIVEFSFEVLTVQATFGVHEQGGVFRAAMWRGLLFASSVFALCSHPTADELSPRARIQDY